MGTHQIKQMMKKKMQLSSWETIEVAAEDHQTVVLVRRSIAIAVVLSKNEVGSQVSLIGALFI